MEIEKIASAVSSAKNIAGAVQSSGAQNSQLEELKRLADSIRKIENDCRVTARVQGLSGTALQMKLRQYDDLLSKVDQQIRDLQRKNQSDSYGRGGVSMLQYNTDVARVTMRTTGQSTGAAVTMHQQNAMAQAQAEAAQRSAEQSAKEASLQNAVTHSKSRLDVLI